MKKQIRKAMIATVAMMLIGVVSLTGVTYAWFSQSTTAVVEDINMGIVAKEGGVLISAIPNPDDWAYRIALDVDVENFEPASTVPSNYITEGTNAGRLKFYNGVIDESALGNIYTVALPVSGRDSQNNYTSNGYYIEKDVYFYNDDLENTITVTLDKEETQISGENLKNVDSAMRLAVVKHGIYDLGTSDMSTVKAANSAAVNIFEFKPLTRLGGAGDREGQIPTYGVKAASKTSDAATSPVAGDYFTVETEENTLKDGNTENDSAYLEKVDNVSPISETNISFDIPANKCYRVTLYIWLEGQDPECKNAISGSDMGIQVGFAKTIKES